jgi:polysaccharide biosynthesis transport protein
MQWRGRLWLKQVRRWVVPVIAAAVAGGLAALLISGTITPEYRSTATLYLTPGSSANAPLQDVTLGQALARNYVQLATAEGVLRAAMDKIRWGGEFQAFRDATQVAQVRDTSIIAVSFRDKDPQRAADAANAVAQAFIDQNQRLESDLQGTVASQLNGQIESVETDIHVLDTQIAPLQATLAASAPTGQNAARAEQQAQLLTLEGLRQSKQGTLAQLVTARDDIRLTAARSRNNVSLWQSATPPVFAETPKVPLNTALGTFAGAILAALAIGVVTYRDDRLSDREAVAERLGVGAIAEIQRGERPESLGGKLFVRDAPGSAEAEAFRSLRTNIFFANVDRRPQTILITSAVPLEGKSVVSANLALAFAQAGTPTILIDADLRRPSQHRLFRINRNPGLTSLLTGETSISTVPQMEVAPNLIVIPSGPLPPNPAELLSSTRMAALISELRQLTKESALIIDTSPLLSVTDAAVLATRVDGCVLVIDSSRTHAGVAQRALEALRQVRAPILGVVLNNVVGTDASEYEYPSEASAETG